MLNPLKFFNKFIRSSNQRELDKIQKIVNLVNKLEEKISKFNEEDFSNQTKKLVSSISNGSSLNDVLPEAFAMVREASKRVIKEKHYDVQIIGGVVLNDSKI